MSSIKKNIKEIENKIKLCKKSGQDVSLIAISKYFPKEKIQQEHLDGSHRFKY